MAGLSSKEREAVRLQAEGYTLEEVGERVGRSKSMVSRTIKAAREKMRQALERSGLAEPDVFARVREETTRPATQFTYR